MALQLARHANCWHAMAMHTVLGNQVGWSSTPVVENSDETDGLVS